MRRQEISKTALQRTRISEVSLASTPDCLDGCQKQDSENGAFVRWAHLWVQARGVLGRDGMWPPRFQQTRAEIQSSKSHQEKSGWLNLLLRDSQRAGRRRGDVRRADLISQVPFPSRARCGPGMNACVSMTLIPVHQGNMGLCTCYNLCAWTWGGLHL